MKDIIQLDLMCAAMMLHNVVLAVDNIDIPYSKYLLDNGLTLIVHEDHKAPVVAVSVWYHVGSKNEREGRTGFAHLFEHLMFNGSENFNDDYFKPFDRVGATGMNGTTNFDRTNYFEVVPKNALDVALWMESDRMGHLLGVIDQAKLDEQRGVVQNEKRQGENQPYGKVFNEIFRNVFPKGHPYSWPVIGYMKDLDAASLKDVHQWFEQYYGAANTVIVIAGDVEAGAVKEKVEHYFGHIEAGPPLIKQKAWIAKRTGKHRQQLQDRGVPQARIYKVWNVPPLGTAAADEMALVADVLARGKTSRLYKRLVYDDQIASDVNAVSFSLEISGLFGIIVTALPGKELAEIEKAVDEEIARFLDKGPTKKELALAQTRRNANFIRDMERVGSFGGKSDILAQNEIYLGDPSAYKVTLQRWANATPRKLRALAYEWLQDGEYIMEVYPFDEYTTVESKVNREKLPESTAFPKVSFDELQRETLSNGLRIILAERKAIPVVELSMMINAGYAADQFALPGTSNLAMNMLDEGTRKRNALGISDELARLGATLSSNSDLDVSLVSMSALRDNLDASLDLFADVILNPAFPENEFTRLQTQQLARIKQEKVTPVSMALRVFPKMLYGKNHAYGLPMTGSGTEESVRALNTEKLRDFHATWFKPNNATLVVVGDVDMASLKPKLKFLFKSWQQGSPPKKQLDMVEHKSKSSIYLIDRPDSEQSIIFAGHIAPPKRNDNEIAIEVMNEVLGGSFNARINMNLREDKHWSYGAHSIFVDAQGQRPFLVYASVQTDKTKESMAEIYKELADIRTTRPPGADEVARAKDKKTLTLAGRWETNRAVASSIREMVRFGYPDNFWSKYSDNIRALNNNQVEQAATDVVQPDKMVWVVVGDRAKIENRIRELNYGEIFYMDTDGNQIAQ